MVDICPSILSADFTRLGEDIDAVIRGGANYIHLDVMDGHFVPNLTVGIPVLKSIRPITPVKIDAHLMISNPLAFAGKFAKAGADLVVVHSETIDSGEAFEQISGEGAGPGIALNPDTPWSAAEPYLEDLDLIVLMTVYPGFSGQKFMPAVVPKIADAAMAREENGYRYLIQVDGGVNLETIGTVVDAGANMVVAGSAAYSGGDPEANVRALIEAGRR